LEEDARPLRRLAKKANVNNLDCQTKKRVEREKRFKGMSSWLASKEEVQEEPTRDKGIRPTRRENESPQGIRRKSKSSGKGRQDKWGKNQNSGNQQRTKKLRCGKAARRTDAGGQMRGHARTISKKQVLVLGGYQMYT